MVGVRQGKKGNGGGLGALRGEGQGPCYVSITHSTACATETPEVPAEKPFRSPESSRPGAGGQRSFFPAWSDPALDQRTSPRNSVPGAAEEGRVSATRLCVKDRG